MLGKTRIGIVQMSRSGPTSKEPRMSKSGSTIKDGRTIKGGLTRGIERIRTLHVKQESMSTKTQLMGKRAASETSGVTRNFAVRPELAGNRTVRDHISA
jgi:hypothetical protein